MIAFTILVLFTLWVATCVMYYQRGQVVISLTQQLKSAHKDTTHWYQISIEARQDLKEENKNV